MSDTTRSMRELVDALCSDVCAGRAPGTAGHREARRLVVEAMRGAGLDPFEQAVPAARGSNVLAIVPGELDRYVLIGSHYDHLGTVGGEIYRGADDNAAAVAILVEVGRALATGRLEGRGVILAAFDAEEPPHFLSSAMGSEHFALHPVLPLETIDLAIVMDLVGHTVGHGALPEEVQNTVFALGAERSAGTAKLVESTQEEGVFVRRIDAEIIPPMSDYAPFWKRERPFLFLTNGRSRVYHTPEDVPDALAWNKMAATAKWLEAFVRAACSRDSSPSVFTNQRDDASTLESLLAITASLSAYSPEAALAKERLRSLRSALRADGTLPEPRYAELLAFASGLESALA
ncbi:MAG: M28 family peptidase [Polyangiaceae bacterium]|nr:M28 family peptidase [Polyangiaceae bacterium]